MFKIAKYVIALLLVLQLPQNHALDSVPERGHPLVIARTGCDAQPVPDRRLSTLRKELEATREERDNARREILELRRKLKDLTSIEKSMDERKAH